MAHCKKKGRKATQRTRSSAARLVEAYGPVTVNMAYARDLVVAWEHFSENGLLPNESHDRTPHASGRRGTASPEARDAAKDLVDAYGPPIQSVTGSVCLNPDDDPETISSFQASAPLKHFWMPWSALPIQAGL